MKHELEKVEAKIKNDVGRRKGSNLDRRCDGQFHVHLEQHCATTQDAATQERPSWSG
jgi:hypothetical protein